MKKRDEIKLDALSQINDDIIERNTVKRARLLAHPRIKRSIIYSASAIAACLAIALSVVIGILGGGGGVNPPVITPGQIPVYEGMTVSNTYNTVETASRTRDRLLLPKPPHKDDVKQDDEIQDSLGVAGAMEEIYYATVGQDVYVSVHINNPDQYEILSFTLNGKTYSSYMFEEGSDMETLVLKVNVGEITGIKEYTIDAIKYVDGTEIKDVRMEGDRTVAISVGDGTVPSASVSALSSYYSLSFTVDLSDFSGLIEYYGNYVYLVLSDENGNVLRSVRILNSEMPVIIDGLTQNTDYGYAVFAVYKSESDKNPDVHILTEGSAKTTSGLAYLGANVTQNESSHSVSLTAGINEGTQITAVKILLGETVVNELEPSSLLAEGGAVISLSDLLYSKTYTIVVEFMLGGEVYTDSVSFTTPTLSAPTVNISNITTEEGSVSLRVSGANASLTATSVTVDILLNGEVVDTRIITSIGTEIGEVVVFDGLDDGTEYTVKAIVGYDLQDGEGEKTVTATVPAKTKATVTATNMIMRSASTLLAGEKLLLQITLANDNNAVIDAVILNGVKYNVSVTSTTKLLNLEIDTQLLGAGTHTVTLDALVSGNRIIESNASFSVSFTVKAKMSFAGVDIVSKSGTTYESKICFDYGEILFVRIKLNDGDGCTLTSVTVYNNSYDGIIKLDANNFLLPLLDITSYTDKNVVELYVDSFTYVFEGKTGSITVKQTVSASILPEISAETKYVYTVEDFKNMDDGYHYVLANDIDLAGANWTPTVFKGSFDGNGYAVKNFTCIGGRESSTGFIHTSDYPNSNSYAGLFYSADGVISNLRLEGMYVNIAYYYLSDYFQSFLTFSLFGSGTHTLYNCSVDDTSSISIDMDADSSTDYNSTYFVLFSGQLIYGCTSYVSISVNNTVSDMGVSMFNSTDVRDCKMGGSLYISGAGIPCHPKIQLPALENCVNTSTVNVESCVVYLGDETILGGEYSGGTASGRIVFTENGYYIGDGNTPTPPDDNEGTVFEVNLVVYEENLAYNEDGQTLMSRMGLDLADYEIPEGTETVVIYFPDNYNGIPITVIEFVRIMYNGETPEFFEAMPSALSKITVKVVIPNGVKVLGMMDNFEVNPQPFAHGIIHELVIPKSVETVYSDSFNWRSAFLYKINCESEAKPAGWSDSWNKTSATVNWGYKDE